MATKQKGGGTKPFGIATKQKGCGTKPSGIATKQKAGPPFFQRRQDAHQARAYQTTPRMKSALGSRAAGYLT
jgi:hypothetical protein